MVCHLVTFYRPPTSGRRWQTSSATATARSVRSAPNSSDTPAGCSCTWAPSTTTSWSSRRKMSRNSFDSLGSIEVNPVIIEHLPESSKTLKVSNFVGKQKQKQPHISSGLLVQQTKKKKIVLVLFLLYNFFALYKFIFVLRLSQSTCYAGNLQTGVWYERIEFLLLRQILRQQQKRKITPPSDLCLASSVVTTRSNLTECKSGFWSPVRLELRIDFKRVWFKILKI